MTMSLLRTLLLEELDQSETRDELFARIARETSQWRAECHGAIAYRGIGWGHIGRENVFSDQTYGIIEGHRITPLSEYVFDNSNASDSGSAFILKQSAPVGRKPRNTAPAVHAIFDDHMLDVAGFRARSSAVFISGFLGTARSYGTPYVCLPCNGYKYAWSPTVSDMYVDIPQGLFRQLLDLHRYFSTHKDEREEFIAETRRLNKTYLQKVDSRLAEDVMTLVESLVMFGDGDHDQVLATRLRSFIFSGAKKTLPAIKSMLTKLEAYYPDIDPQDDDSAISVDLYCTKMMQLNLKLLLAQIEYRTTDLHDAIMSDHEIMVQTDSYWMIPVQVKHEDDREVLDKLFKQLNVNAST